MEQKARSVFKLCCLAVVVLSVWATGQELKLGILAHDVAPLFGATKVEKGVDFNGEFVCGENLFRVVSGISINSSGGTHYIYSGVGVHHWFGGGSLQFSLGGAYCRNYERGLGGPWQFRLTVEVGYKKFSIIYCHLSNGKDIFGWNIPNAGLDCIGVRFRL